MGQWNYFWVEVNDGEALVVFETYGEKSHVSTSLVSSWTYEGTHGLGCLNVQPSDIVYVEPITKRQRDDIRLGQVSGVVVDINSTRKKRQRRRAASVA